MFLTAFTALEKLWPQSTNYVTRVISSWHPPTFSSFPAHNVQSLQRSPHASARAATIFREEGSSENRIRTHTQSPTSCLQPAKDLPPQAQGCTTHERMSNQSANNYIRRTPSLGSTQHAVNTNVGGVRGSAQTARAHYSSTGHQRRTQQELEGYPHQQAAAAAQVQSRVPPPPCTPPSTAAAQMPPPPTLLQPKMPMPWPRPPMHREAQLS